MKLHTYETKLKQEVTIFEKTSENLQQRSHSVPMNMRRKLVFLYTNSENVNCHNLYGEESVISGL